jgi:hypothetical protein
MKFLTYCDPFILLLCIGVFFKVDLFPGDVIDVKESADIEKKEEDVEQKPRPPRKRRWGGRKVSPKRQISISSESLKVCLVNVHK